MTIRPTYLLAATLTATGRTAGVGFAGLATLSIQGGVGTVQLQRSNDAGNSWHSVSKNNDGDAASWDLNDTGIELEIENEDPTALYAVNCSAYTSGNILCRISR